MSTSAFVATAHAAYLDPKPATSPGTTGRSTRKSCQHQRLQRHERHSEGSSGFGSAVDAHAAATAAAAAAMSRKRRALNTSGTKRLTRRTVPDDDDALAEALLRKIERLRAGSAAYVEHFGGGGGGGAGVPGAEHERLELLKKDYQAWLRYCATGELPEQVYSEGMDLPRRHEDSYGWLAYLTPAEQQEAEEALAGSREWYRLKLYNKAKRAAWLAKYAGQGVRLRLFDIMRRSYNTVCRLYQHAVKAGAPLQRKASPASGAGAKRRRKPTGTARSKPVGDWMKYLDEEDQRLAEATRAGSNIYNIYLKHPERRAELLAAHDVDGMGDAMWEKVHQDRKTHNRLNMKALARKKKIEAALAEQQKATQQRTPSTDGKEERAIRGGRCWARRSWTFGYEMS